MPKIAVEVDVKQIEQVIGRLKVTDRLALIRRLEQRTWGERFRSLEGKIDERRKRYPVSAKELSGLIQQARQQRHAARCS